MVRDVFKKKLYAIYIYFWNIMAILCVTLFFTLKNGEAYVNQDDNSQNNPSLSADQQDVRLSSDNGGRVREVPGHIIVKLKKGKDLNDIASLNKKHSIVSSQKVFHRDVKTSGKVNMTTPNKAAEERLMRRLEKRKNRAVKRIDVPRLDDVYKLRLPAPSGNIKTIVEEYINDPSVEFAEIDPIAEAYYVPSDPLYSSQWAHQKTQAENGWDLERGGPDTVIAIIDTGVDHLHEDLSANIWHDPVGGNKGMDFVDINTADYIAAGYQLIPGEDYITLDDDPMDFHGHGTHVAGIAAAADNNKGITGVCPGCQIMAVRAGFSITYQGRNVGLFDYSTIADAIRYATDNGADIISMSLGGTATNNTLRDAIDYAASQGVVVVAAAGNSRSQIVSYPAGYDNVISVTATAQDDTKAGYSNYGYWVDVAAPGGDSSKDTMILSTVPLNGTISDPSGYKTLQGTSMACPYVAGIAGLILSLHPDYTAYQVEKAITQSQSVDPVQNQVIFIGEGRVNIVKALQAQVLPGVIAEIESPVRGEVVTETLSIIGTATQNYDLDRGIGDYPTSWTPIASGFGANHSILGFLEIGDIPNGTVTLRLRLSSFLGSMEDTVRFQKYVRSFDFVSGWPQSLSGLQAGYSSPAVADIDNDGDLEVVIGASSGNLLTFEPTVYAWRHDGTVVQGWPKYTEATGPFGSEGVSASPALADLDKDGHLEIIVVAWDGKVYIWRHDGSDFMPGAWPKQLATQSIYSTTPVVADIDDDGNMEIMVISKGADLYVWHWDGTSYLAGQDGLFYHFPSQAAHISPAVADLDGDGMLEIIVALGSIYAFHEDGSIYWVTQNIGAEYVIVGDIDQDNIPEVIVKAGVRVYAYKNDGRLASGNWPFSSVNEMLYEPFLGDINGSSELEIVVPSLEGKVYVLNNNGGLATPILSTPGRVAYSASGIGDVDGDGRSDIILATGGGDSSLAIYAWKQDGTLVAGFPFKVPREGAGISYGFTSSPALADLDHDGKLDIIVAAQGSGKVYAFKTGALYKPSTMQWPTYRHDLRRTGSFQKPLRIVFPNGGEVLTAGGTQNIRWNTAGTVGAVKLEYSTDGGATYPNLIATSVGAGAETYAWTVPNAMGNQVQIKITSITDPAISDTSDTNFEIKLLNQAPVLNPVGNKEVNQGSNLTFTLSATDPDNNPLTYSANGLPMGAALNSTNGRFSWTPTHNQAGNYLITFIVSDGQLTDSETITVTVNMVPAITVTSPNGGEVWGRWLNKEITWRALESIANVRIEYSTNGFQDETQTRLLVSSTRASTGRYTWLVPHQPPATNVKIRVSNVADSQIYDISDASFSISNRLRVITPNGGEAWSPGTVQEIVWEALPDVDKIIIYYSLDGGLNFPNLIAYDFPASQGRLSWTIPANINSNSVRVKVRHSAIGVVVDSDDSDANFSIVGPSVTINYPNGSQVLTVGNAYNITWNSIGSVGNVKLEYSTDGGATYPNLIAASVNADLQTYAWTVPDTVSNQVRVKITSNSDSAISDASDANFKIIHNSLNIASPDGGEVWGVGSTHNITWNTVGTGTVKLEYSTDGGATYPNLITASVNADLQTYAWTVPNAVGNQLRIKITSTTDASINDMSDANFQIAQSPVTVISPNGGETLTVGTTHYITWSAIAAAGNTVKLEYSTDGGATYPNLISASVITNLGTYAWPITANKVGRQLRIKITSSMNANIHDTSNANFQIVPSMTVISPNGGNVFTVGSVQNITWGSLGAFNTVKLEYSTDGGATYPNLIAASVNANLGTYAWTVPNTVSNQVRVKITNNYLPASSDTSDANFSIAPPSPDLTITQFIAEYPAQGDLNGNQFTAIEGQKFYWTVTFQNRGNAPAGTNTLSFYYIDGQGITREIPNMQQTIPTPLSGGPLQPGEVQTYVSAAQWTAPAPGTYQIKAMIDSGESIAESSETNNSSTKTLIVTPDTVPPTVPQNLQASAFSPYRVDLRWSPSTDNVNLVAYRIYRNGTMLSLSTRLTSWSDSTVLPSTSYTYTVLAYDSSPLRNRSAQSSPVTVITPKVPSPTPSP